MTPTERAVNSPAREADTLKAIADYLRARGFRIFRRNVAGAVRMARGGVVHVGQRGQADLYGWEVGTGRHIEVEVKRPGRDTTPRLRRAMQDGWILAAQRDGCIAFRTDSVKDCEEWLIVFEVGP